MARRVTFQGWRRATPREVAAHGLPKRSYIKEGEPIRRETAISDRQFYQKKNRAEGRPGTKEARTKALKAGKARYRTKTAKTTEAYKRRAAGIRNAIPEITSKDAKLIDKKLRQGWDNLTPAERLQFRQLFDKYPREEVLAALGSPPTK
jgi:hypothetical protein